MTLQSNPFVVAAAVAITGASAIVATDWFVSDTLQIHRIASADAPIIDGDTSDPVWRTCAAVLRDDQPGWKSRRQGRIQDRYPRGARRHLGLFPVHMGGSDALVEATAADQASRRMARAAQRLRTRRRARLQRGQVFRPADDDGRRPRGRPHLPCEPSAFARRARHHDRPRPALHDGGGSLCRCVAVEGDQHQPHRMDG